MGGGLSGNVVLTNSICDEEGMESNIGCDRTDELVDSGVCITHCSVGMGSELDDPGLGAQMLSCSTVFDGTSKVGMDVDGDIVV